MLGKIKTGAAIALLLGASVAVHAAGLGKLTVNSALGQILAAEIDLVSLQPGELDSLTARVASPEAYREAKIDYSSVLRLLRFSVEKRANGAPYVKVSSVAPVNEPFVDMLIEITWPAGRLQREYPILLDPPGFAEARGAAVVAAAPAAAPAPAPAADTSAPAPSAATGTPSAKAEMDAGKPAAGAAQGKDTYGPVKKGETLRKIAGEVKEPSVSMEQMLAALYRENKAAFIENNMNLLRAGKILRVPSGEEVGKIASKEANEEVRTHVANWKSYREGLAGGVATMPAKPESSQAASGKVAGAAIAPPPAPSAAGKDVLKLSKTETSRAGASAGTKAGGAAQDRVSALQEEVTAKDKALKEAQSRVSDLEKQIRDMQRLIDLKAGAPKAATAEPAKGPEPVKVPDAKVAAAVTPAEAPKPAEVKPAEPAKAPEPPKAVEAPKPAEPKPAPAKKVAPPPPPPEPSLMDTAMENLPYVVGGAGLLGLLGLGGVVLARRRKASAEAGPVSALSSAFPSDLKPNTVTGKAGGGLVDTGNSSFLTDFDKTGPGTIDTDEVDPVAEAEVYIAYGRDSQAEEILKEAMARDKSCHEIPLKLLEIYHARKSATAFETVARELRGAVGGDSPLWQKAAVMGAQIDPNNPLYGGAAAAASAVADAAPVAKPGLDFDLDSSSSAAPAAEQATPSSFDLDLGGARAATPPAPAPSRESPALDFDIDSAALPASAAPGAPGARDEKPAFDFDLSGLDFPAPGAPAKPAAPASFDQTIGMSAAPAPELADLNLGEAGQGGDGDAVSTKLELAKAYLEIGDKDGAREILQEVAKEGSGAQKDEAQKLIASL